jgi:hypothetical protein
MPTATKKVNKGGSLTKNVSNLMVPFTLMAAKSSIEKFLKQQEAKKAQKVAKGGSAKPKTSLKGGSKTSVSAHAMSLKGGKSKK